MNIYIDESGSINNHSANNKNFIIALIYVTDKKALDRAYKRFVSSNFERLKELDKPKVNAQGKEIKPGNWMREMKKQKLNSFWRITLILS